jgi:hypothetical protein
MCMHAVATTPAEPLPALIARLPSDGAPLNPRRVGFRITLLEACSAFTGRCGPHAR